MGSSTINHNKLGKTAMKKIRRCRDYIAHLLLVLIYGLSTLLFCGWVSAQVTFFPMTGATGQSGFARAAQVGPASLSSHCKNDSQVPGILKQSLVGQERPAPVIKIELPIQEKSELWLYRDLLNGWYMNSQREYFEDKSYGLVLVHIPEEKVKIVVYSLHGISIANDSDRFWPELHGHLGEALAETLQSFNFFIYKSTEGQWTLVVTTLNGRVAILLDDFYLRLGLYFEDLLDRLLGTHISHVQGWNNPSVFVSRPVEGGSQKTTPLTPDAGQPPDNADKEKKAGSAVPENKDKTVFSPVEKECPTTDNNIQTASECTDAEAISPDKYACWFAEACSNPDNEAFKDRLVFLRQGKVKASGLYNQSSFIALAALAVNERFAKELIEKGADLLSEDQYGVSAIDYFISGLWNVESSVFRAALDQAVAQLSGVSGNLDRWLDSASSLKNEEWLTRRELIAERFGSRSVDEIRAQAWEEKASPDKSGQPEGVAPNSPTVDGHSTSELARLLIIHHTHLPELLRKMGERYLERQISASRPRHFSKPEKVPEEKFKDEVLTVIKATKEYESKILRLNAEETTFSPDKGELECIETTHLSLDELKNKAESMVTEVDKLTSSLALLKYDQDLQKRKLSSLEFCLKELESARTKILDKNQARLNVKSEWSQHNHEKFMNEVRAIPTGFKSAEAKYVTPDLEQQRLEDVKKRFEYLKEKSKKQYSDKTASMSDREKLEYDYKLIYQVRHKMWENREKVQLCVFGQYNKGHKLKNKISQLERDFIPLLNDIASDSLKKVSQETKKYPKKLEMISSVAGSQQVSGHFSSDSLASAAENCLQKYIPTSADTSVNFTELKRRTLYELKNLNIKLIKTPKHCCLGVCIEWIERYLDSTGENFNYYKARLLHQEYWRSIESSERWDTLANKKKECVELTRQFLHKKVHNKGINIDVEPHSFNHIKSLVAPLTQAFFLLPKCCTLLIIHGINEKKEFQGHNFVISWTIQDKNEAITFFEPAGTQITWKKESSETYSNFFIRAMDFISDIIGCTIKGDCYFHETIESILLYKGESIVPITDVD